MLAGCVQSNETTSGELAKEYLELWMAKWNKDNGKDIAPTDMGLYILEDIPGTGDLRDADSVYIYAKITIRTLSGTISSTDDEALAKQLGTYTKDSWYGPRFAATGEDVNYAGVDLLLDGMRLGGTRRAIIPAWLLTSSRYSTMEKYLDKCSSTTSLDYTITLVDQTLDPNEYEIRKLTEYMNANYPGAQPSPMPEEDEADGSFWFISDVSAFSEDDAREDSETGLSLNYTGRRLDGFVFDTSVEKTAIDNDIWSSSRTYGSLPVVFSSTWSDITVDGDSYIDGFKAALYMMKYPGQKATVMFTSKHGYTSTGTGNAIPGYCTLIFDIELLED